MNLLYIAAYIGTGLLVEHVGRMSEAAWRPTTLVRTYVVPALRTLFGKLGSIFAELAAIPARLVDFFEEFGKTLGDVFWTFWELLCTVTSFFIQFMHRLWTKFGSVVNSFKTLVALISGVALVYGSCMGAHGYFSGTMPSLIGETSGWYALASMTFFGAACFCYSWAAEQAVAGDETHGIEPLEAAELMATYETAPASTGRRSRRAD